MGLTSNTGLLAVPQKPPLVKPKEHVELRCDVAPAPFVLRPFAGLYNPFASGCSVLCNHPANPEAKEYVKRVKGSWMLDSKGHCFHEDLAKFQEMEGADKEKIRTPHDLVTEDMFRRYAETDSRPLTPAPTLASGKSRGSRRCLTPDQPRERTAIVLDLRRSHSQETLYYHGYATSDVTAGHTTVLTTEPSTVPTLNLADSRKLLKGQPEQLPPLASPLVLSRRALPPKEAAALKNVRKMQLKALNLGKPKPKKKGEQAGPSSQRSKDKDVQDGSEDALDADDAAGGESRRRGKRRRKGRQGGSDRLTSAGLAAQSQQDPETQIAGVMPDSQNPSSRGSIAPTDDDDLPLPPPPKPAGGRKTDSFLDDDILKYLHREVDEDAIHTEFDAKRRYVLEEALRTRPPRPPGAELAALLRELRVPAVSLGDWLHVPRVFSRQNAQFSLPIDTNDLEILTPMKYAARFVTLKRSKQLLYLTVLRKFRPEGYRMPIENLEEGLTLMMGGILSAAQAAQFGELMEWADYVEEESLPDDIKLTLDHGRKEGGDAEEPEAHTLRYRTWCGVCAVCERLHGRYPPRDRDPPDGIELSDFTMLETKLPHLKVHPGLVEVLNTIRTR